MFATSRIWLALSVAALAFLAACSSSTTEPSSSSLSSAAADLGSTSTPSTDQHNAADLMFAQMMIVHHRGAIEMADLAPTRAASQEVKDLAATIKAAQAPEIELMSGWLTAWGMPAVMSSAMGSGTSGGMGRDMDDMGGGMGGGTSGTASTSVGAADAGVMPGMMTDEEMTALTAASGTDFDTLFLTLMITHHQGALAMADSELVRGSNADALALAAAIKVSQTAEIATMQQMLGAK